MTLTGHAKNPISILGRHRDQAGRSKGLAHLAPGAAGKSRYLTPTPGTLLGPVERIRHHKRPGPKGSRISHNMTYV